MLRSSPTRGFLVGLAAVLTLVAAYLALPGVSDSIVREISRKTDEVSYQIMASFPQHNQR